MSSQTTYISEILTKLNHPLDDIRCRAVKNITNKLHRNLIKVEEICQYPNLPRFLLDIFNNEIISNPDEVLELIQLITLNQTGAILIINIGGFDFLSHLKLDCKQDGLKRIIDSILSNLLKIEDGYKIDEGNKVHYTLKIENLENLKNDMKIDKSCSFYDQEFGYFNDADSSIVHMSRLGDNLDTEINDLFHFCLFPTIPLTDADKKVLTSSLGTLRNDDFRLVLSGIQFFSDVILEDFPTAVFLQRQGALKVLLHNMSDNRFTSAAIQALIKFCEKMVEFIENASHPEYFSTKNTFYIVKQTDEEDYSNARKCHKDDMLELVFEPTLQTPVHLPVPVFCMQVISQCLIQIHEFDSNRSPSSLSSTVLLFWPRYVDLMRHSITLLRCSLTSSNTASSTKTMLQLDPWNMSELVVEQLNLWTQLLMKYSKVEDPDLRAMVNNRQIYTALFSIFWDLFDTIMTPEMALKYTPEECRMQIADALFDLSLATLLKERMSTVWEYVKLFNQPAAKLYGEVRQLIDSTGHLLHFFLNYNEPIKYAEICVEAASQSLLSINFIHTTKFPKDFINLFSIIAGTELFTNNDALLSQCDSIIYHLSCSSNNIIVKSLFSEMFHLFSSEITVDKIAASRSAASYSSVERKVWFLLRPAVFRIVILKGLFSAIEEVFETVSALLVKLWDSKGLLSRTSWEKVVDLTTNTNYNHGNMLLLIPFADTNTRLGRCIIDWSIHHITNSNMNALTTLDKENNQSKIKQNLGNLIRPLLPLYYHKLPDVRREAANNLKQLILLASNIFIPKNSNDKIVMECQVKIENMIDLLLVATDGSQGNNLQTRWFSFGSKSQQKSGIDDDNFKKVCEIFMSASVDVSVRKTAAEQLCIFLQNPQLHNRFLDQGGLKYVLQLIHGRLFDKAHTSLLLPSSILLLLRMLIGFILNVNGDPSHKPFLLTSSETRELTWQLVQVALNFCYDKHCLADISVILCFLVVMEPLSQSQSDMASNKSNLAQIFLPDIYQDKLSLPVSPFATYFKIEPIRVNSRVPTFTNSLLYRCMPPLTMGNSSHGYYNETDWEFRAGWREKIECSIRLAWCLMKYGGLVNYSRETMMIDGRSEEEEDELANQNDPAPQYKLIDEIFQENDMEQGYFKGQSQIALTSNDQYLLHNSYPELVLSQSLRQIENATSHCQVESCLVTIHSTFSLLLLLSKRNNNQTTSLIDSIITNPHTRLLGLRRFLLNIPASSADYIVLDLILDVLDLIHEAATVLCRLSVKQNYINWFLEKILLIEFTKNSSNNSNAILHCLLRGDNLIGQTDSRRLSLVKLKLQSHLPRFLVGLVRSFGMLETESSQLAFIDWCINLCMNKLLYIFEEEGKPFENMGSLYDWLTLLSACISKRRQLTLDMKLNINGDDGEDSDNKMRRLFCSAAQLITKLTSSSNSRQNETCISFMGTGIINLILNILMGFIRCPFNNSSWSPGNWKMRSPWLLELLGYRSVVTRTRALLLINLLSKYDETRQSILVRCLEILPENLYSVLMTLYSDETEATIVRSVSIATIQNLLLCANNESINYTNDIIEIILQNDHEIIRKIALILIGYCSQNTQSSLVNTSVSLLINLYCLIPNKMGDIFQSIKFNTILMSCIDCSNVRNDNKLKNLIAIETCMRLLRLQMCCDSSIKESVLEDDKFIDRIIKMMNVFVEEKDQYGSFIDFKLELMTFLIGLVTPRPFSQRLLASLIVQLATSITSFFQFVKSALVIKNTSDLLKQSTLITTCLQMLIVYLSIDNSGNADSSHKNNTKQPRNKLVQLLDTIQIDNETDGGRVFMMEELCKILTLKRDDCIRHGGGMLLTNSKKQAAGSNSGKLESTKSLERYNLHTCIKVLVGVSRVAKETMINNGLIESITGEIKYIHTKLDKVITTIIRPSPAVTSSTVTNSTSNTSCYNTATWKQGTKELVLILETMQNLLHDCDDAQQAVITTGTHQTIYRLWTLALLDPHPNRPIFHALLSCLCNLSSGSSSRILRSLSFCHQSPQGNDQPPSSAASISLVENLTNRIITNYNNNQSDCIICFKLLSNMAWAPEALIVLTRLRFLEKFVELNPNQLQKSKRGLQLMKMWLYLLTTLSFTSEGSLSLLNRISAIHKSANTGFGSEIVQVLAGMVQINILRQPALLVIRNLSCHSVIKQKLFVEGSDILECIQSCVTDDEISNRYLTLSLLKCLMYNNNKIRSYFKTTSIAEKLKEARDEIEHNLSTSNQKSNMYGKTNQKRIAHKLANQNNYGMLLLSDISLIISLFYDQPDHFKIK